uniref:Uncharacterized protein n=1 Tax=Cannabis sativa TaxID=3483 RepID=A0A803QSD5_CANSA
MVATLANNATTYIQQDRDAQGKYDPTQVQDAALDGTKNIIGVGAIVRNSLGSPVTALSKPIMELHVVHVKRSANMAKGLAKYALELDEACFWTELFPPPIYSVIVNDLR